MEEIEQWWSPHPGEQSSKRKKSDGKHGAAKKLKSDGKQGADKKLKSDGKQGASKKHNSDGKQGASKQAPSHEESADDGGENEKEVSFARRPPPKKCKAYTRWSAVKLAFQDKISMYVDHPSKYQDILQLGSELFLPRSGKILVTSALPGPLLEGMPANLQGQRKPAPLRKAHAL